MIPPRSCLTFFYQGIRQRRDPASKSKCEDVQSTETAESGRDESAKETNEEKNKEDMVKREYAWCVVQVNVFIIEHRAIVECLWCACYLLVCVLQLTAHWICLFLSGNLRWTGRISCCEMLSGVSFLMRILKCLTSCAPLKIYGRAAEPSHVKG